MRFYDAIKCRLYTAIRFTVKPEKNIFSFVDNCLISTQNKCSESYWIHQNFSHKRAFNLTDKYTYILQVVHPHSFRIYMYVCVLCINVYKSSFYEEKKNSNFYRNARFSVLELDGKVLHIYIETNMYIYLYIICVHITYSYSVL